MGEGDIKRSGGRVRVWSKWLICCIVLGQNDDLGWWILLSNWNDAGVSLWTIWSAVVIQGISPTTCPGFCASQKQWGPTREGKVWWAVLEVFNGKLKIQKYVSVVLTSCRVAIALILPTSGGGDAWPLNKPSSLSSEDTAPDFPSKEIYLCTYNLLSPSSLVLE